MGCRPGPREPAAVVDRVRRATDEPSACGHCGIPEREHAQRWKPPVGWHQWAAPTDEQIKARMKGRRAARTNPNTEEEL